MRDEEEIRVLLNKRIEALARRDAVSANALLHSDVVAFELAGPLQTPAAQASDDAATQAWLDSFAEGPNVTMEDVHIYSEGAIAFCHSINRLQGRCVDGRQVDVQMRSTLGFRKMGGKWSVVHAHTSLPR